MDKNIYKIFAPDAAIQSKINIGFEFSHVATYGNDVPHTVVFVSDNDLLQVPVSHFVMGDYEEWKDSSILSPREVGRAAAELALRR